MVAVQIRRLVSFWKVNLDQTVEMYDNNLEWKVLKPLTAN
jgi:hypothetical protein